MRHRGHIVAASLSFHTLTQTNATCLTDRKYQQYLQAVLAENQGFTEIEGILLRYQMLEQAYAMLVKQREKTSKANEDIQATSQKFFKASPQRMILFSSRMCCGCCWYFERQLF